MLATLALLAGAPRWSPGREAAAAVSADRAMGSATFGMGCFWSPQAAFQRVDGVVRATAGYASIDGSADGQASYFSVCMGDGRTEAVRVYFDPSAVTYAQLIDVFWNEHDASLTVPGKERQYASVIWAHDAEQRKLAEASVEEAFVAYSAAGRQMPATTVVCAGPAAAGAPAAGAPAAPEPPRFIPAESYHQNFWPKLRLKGVGLGVLQLVLVASASPDDSSQVVEVVREYVAVCRST